MQYLPRIAYQFPFTQQSARLVLCIQQVEVEVVVAVVVAVVVVVVVAVVEVVAVVA
jgi:hypothetical protein